MYLKQTPRARNQLKRIAKMNWTMAVMQCTLFVWITAVVLHNKLSFYLTISLHYELEIDNTITWLLCAFSLVVDRDRLKDKHTDDVKSTPYYVSRLIFLLHAQKSFNKPFEYLLYKAFLLKRSLYTRYDFSLRHSDVCDCSVYVYHWWRIRGTTLVHNWLGYHLHSCHSITYIKITIVRESCSV